MTDTMLGQAAVYLAAALVCVPSKRLGMGSELGYLLAGILIAPSASVCRTLGGGHHALRRIRRGDDVFLIGMSWERPILADAH